MKHKAVISTGLTSVPLALSSCEILRKIRKSITNSKWVTQQLVSDVFCTMMPRVWYVSQEFGKRQEQDMGELKAC